MLMVAANLLTPACSGYPTKVLAACAAVTMPRSTATTMPPRSVTPLSPEAEAFYPGAGLASDAHGGWHKQGQWMLPAGWSAEADRVGTFSQLFDMADLVYRAGACALPGVMTPPLVSSDWAVDRGKSSYLGGNLARSLRVNVPHNVPEFRRVSPE